MRKMEKQSFGQEIGKLIKRKRRAAGLTQLQLAEDAFGTGAKVRRISELESGTVSNPHPKTIDPIFAVLGITEDEIEICATETSFEPDPDLDRAYREARNLIEAVARMFDHARPESTLAELEDHLRAKALEWRQLQQRIDAIEGIDQDIDKLRRAASDALSKGRLDEVDILLAEAEETQQSERTLAEIERQAEIRITRGDANLFNERPDSALNCYLTAARYFEPFSPEKTADWLDRLAGRVYEISLRALSPRFGVASGLLAALSELPFVKSDPVMFGLANYRRGLVYRAEALGRGETPLNRPLLLEAIEYARLAADAPSDPDRLEIAVSAKISLANGLLELAKHDHNSALLDEAAAILRTARVLAQEEAPSLLPCATNNLGAVLMARRRHGEPEDFPILDEAFSVFLEAVQESEKQCDSNYWGASRWNCARILSEKARFGSFDAKTRGFMRIQSIAEFNAAIETYPQTLFPGRFGEANIELAHVIYEYGLEDAGPFADIYFVRAIKTFEHVISIYQRSTKPKRWAEIHTWVGSIFVDRANLAEEQQAKRALMEQAKICFDEASGTFSDINDHEMSKRCEIISKKISEGNISRISIEFPDLEESIYRKLRI